MKLNSGYIPVESVAPLRGLATALASTRLDPAFSPNLLNAVVRDGELRSRSGYIKIGQTLAGKILGFTQFGPLGSPPSLVVFTSLRQYYYVPLTDLFQDITAQVEGSVAVAAADFGADPDELDITGDYSAHFTVGRRLEVTGSNANDGYYTVKSSAFNTPVTEIVLNESLVDSNTSGTIKFSYKAWSILNAVSGASGTFEVLGSHEAYFANNVVFIVRGTTANDGNYIVTGQTTTSGNTIITVANVPAAQSGAEGTLATVDELTTATEGFIDFAEVTDVTSRRLITTNGANRPRVWSGVLAETFDNWRPAFDDFATMRTIAVFTEHLFLGAVTLATTGEDPQSVAWSNAGDFDNHNTGTSGVQLLHELESPIKRMRTLGDRLVIYSDDQIVNGAFVGLPAVFAFETIIPEGTRLISPKSVIPINVGHVYGSEENIYLFDGTRGMRVIGDTIRNDYKIVKDHDNLFKTASLNDFSKKTMFLAIPDIDGGSMVYTIEYNIFDLSRMVWGKEKYADDVRAFGFLTNTIILTWEDAPFEVANSPWEDEVGLWTGEGEQVDFPVRVFGNEAGEVFMISENAASDNGTSFTMIYDTIDFTIPQIFQSVLGRWGEIEFEVKGDDVDILVSKDLGANFETIESAKAIEGSYRSYIVPIDVSSRTLRVRFQTTKPFRLRWVRLWVRDGGAR